MSNAVAKILFVDDEPQVLALIRQLLTDEDWDCRYLASASEALLALEREPFDLLVSDVSMPGMDGIRLAGEVRQKYPGVIRIFLTAFAQQANIIKALTEGNAQQIIPKPWIAQEFKEIIRSALRQSLSQKTHSREFQILINSIPLLPALPESYTNVRSCVVGDEVNIEKMADYISQDVAICGILLRWANSALFGQRFQVDTIKKAIIVLGTDIVESLVLSEAVNQAILIAPPRIKGFDLLEFKKHSITTAVIARLLVKSLLTTDADRQDRAFVAGLLHDMGKLVVASFFPDKFAAALELARKKNCSLVEAERQTYQSDHGEIGGYLAEWWALPPFIVNAIHAHHHPLSAAADEDIIAAALVANQLSHQFNRGAQLNLPDSYREMFFLSEEAIEILHTETDKTLQAFAS